MKNLLIGSLFALVFFSSVFSARAQSGAPVAADDFYQATFEQNLKVALPGILENDTGTGSLNAELDTDSAAGGTLVLEPDGSFEYEPPGGFLGTDTFTYRAFDGTNYSNIATVTIEVVEPLPGPDYNNELDFNNALQALGYSPLQEGFEDDAVWGGVRTSIVGGPYTAPAISNQGVIWTANNDTSEVTTGGGPAFSGLWGFFTLPHGNYGNGIDCHLPGNCGDGFKGTSSDPFIAIGGWLETNTYGAKIRLILDNDYANPIGFGEQFLGYSHRFFGYIDTAGFHTFEFQEIEGTIDDVKYVFADDFSFAFGAIAPTDVSIAPQGSNVTLSWTGTGADHYEVWHSVNEPHFTPGTDCALSTLCETFVSSPALLAAGIGDPSQNVSYSVKAVNQDGLVSGASNTVGEFDFGLVSGLP